MGRWDSYAEIYAEGPSSRKESFVYEACVKDGRTYVSWADVSGENTQTKITVFATGDKLDAKALQNDRTAIDRLFNHMIIKEINTDPAKDQGSIVDALDLEMRNAKAAPELSEGNGYTGASLNRLAPIHGR